MKNKKALGNLILLVTAFIWGASFVSQRVGMDRIEPFTFNAVRMLISALAMALIIAIRDRVQLARGSHPSQTMSAGEYSSWKRNAVKGGLACGVVLALASISQQVGMVYTTAGKAGFITALYILIVPVISVIFLKKKVGWLSWIAVAIGAVGLYLLSINEGFTIARGDLYVMICALCFSFHILVIDRYVNETDPLRISMIQFCVAAAISGAAALLFEEPTGDKIMSAMVPILYCALIAGAGGYTMQMIGQKYTEPTVASLIMSLESAFALLTGMLFLNERLSGRELAGCAIMFAAIILIQIPMPGKRA